jgi:hypothetical protein
MCVKLDVSLSLSLRKDHRLKVFENRVLSRIFGPKMEEVAGGWRRLYNEECHNLYASPCIIRVIKSRTMICAGHVARMEDVRNSYKFWTVNLKERDQLEDTGIDAYVF